jgi:predicted RNase H-like HicB family nuclease
MHIVGKAHHYLCPESYSWFVRKQLNCFGKDEYLIEIKELAGCVSYGDTFAEAKMGLRESIELWLKHHRLKVPLILNSKAQLIYMVPQMTRKEFEKINHQILQIVMN